MTCASSAVSRNGPRVGPETDAKRPEAPDGNWLPTPKGQAYNLTFRFYRPKGGVADHSYFPPPLAKH